MFEQSTFLYYLFFALGFVGVTLFGYFYRKKFNLSVKQAVLSVLLVYPAVVAWMFFLYWAESGFKNFGGNNIVRIFIWVPVFAWPASRILKIEFKAMLNFIAPLPCVVHGISHFGCIFEGCCCGYPSSVFAIWNPAFKEYRFAIQPIEAIVAIGVIVITVLYTRSKGYRSDSCAYPLMLILFGSTRFLLEFLRDNEKLFWGISNLAIHAFVMFVVGIVWFFIERHYWKKHPPEESVALP